MSFTRTILKAGFSALMLGGVALASAPAQAGASTGTWRNGMQAGPYGVGCYDARCASRNYGGYRRAYRPVQAYPTYRARRAYDDCYTQRRRSVNRWGEVTVRRVRVCN